LLDNLAKNLMQKIKSIIFGILAALGALVLEFVLSDAYFIFSGKEIEMSYSTQITFFLFLVVLIEEIAKYILISKLYVQQKPYEQKISTALLIGLGFALVESTFTYLHQDFSHLYLGITSSAFLHILTAGIIGYLIISRNFQLSALKIVGTSSILHTTYNLTIIYNLGYFLTYSYLTIILLLFIFFAQKTKHLDRI